MSKVILSSESGTQLKTRVGVVLYFFMFLLVFAHVMTPFFPNLRLAVGHDYSYLFPAWLDGEIWFKNNGMDIPWFTPSFCAGQPYFADPQSTYYSLPQLLSLVMSPLNVAFTMSLVSASVIFWGGYALMRSVFVSTIPVALLVATMLMMNGFLPHRMLVGHVTFHGFALVPWIALLLLFPLKDRLQQWVAAIVAGAFVAYWVHSGLGSLLLAGALAVLMIVLLQLLRGAEIRSVLARGSLTGLFAACLAISKLYAASAFLAGFSRTFYTLPGGKSLIDTVLLIGGGLFFPSQTAYRFGVPKLTNVEWTLEPHEWAYNFSSVMVLIAPALLLAALWQWRRHEWKWAFSTRSLILFVLLLLAVLWPLAFNTYTPAWNAILKRIPVINSTSTPLRWVIVYIPLFAIGFGLLLEKVVSRQYQFAVVSLAVIATVGQFASESREYYLAQNYDARPVSVADEFFKAGVFKPEIQSLGTSAEIHAGRYQAKLGGNDTMIAGISQVFCYNPIFGYRLEKFSAAGLSEASVLSVRDGYLNLKNPACYVFPKENACQPGDLFRADQIEEAKKFIHYQPFTFGVSEGQRIANHISFAALCLLVLTLLMWIVSSIRAGLHWLRRNKAEG